MINFSEKYDRKTFITFLKDFLPNDLEEKYEDFKLMRMMNILKSIYFSSVVLDDIMIPEVERSKAKNKT